MNKKYLPLIVLAALAIVWIVAPIISVSLFGVTASFTALDALDIPGGLGLSDILVIFAPLAAIVLGVIATFVKPAIAKLGALIPAAAFIVGLIIYIIDVGFSYLGWGLYVMLILMVINAVMAIKKAE